MKTILYLSCILAAIFAGVSPSIGQFTGKPQYQIEVRCADTVMGKIVVEMFPAIAPKHVRNWDSLVSIHFYDSVAFHRVIPEFMIQGGDPNSRSGPRNTWGYGADDQTMIDAEFNAVSHRRGIISAARTPDPNSATSQFFICVGNPTYLDRQYTVYGNVVSGMEIADLIVDADRDANDNPFEKISIFITRLGSNDDETATPKLVLPVKDSILPAVTTTTLRWNKVPEAMMYRLQVARDSAFSKIVIDTTRSLFDSSFRMTNLKKGNQYFWRVQANNGGKESNYSDIWNFIIEFLGVEKTSQNDFEFTVIGHTTDKSTILRFSLDDPSLVSLEIYDILGRTILTPISSQLLSGEREIKLTSGMVTPGFYLCRLNADGKSIVRQIIIE